MKTLVPRQLISKKLSLGRFKGPIQYIVWKEMQSILSPGISGKELLIPIDPNLYLI